MLQIDRAERQAEDGHHVGSLAAYLALECLPCHASALGQGPGGETSADVLFM